MRKTTLLLIGAAMVAPLPGEAQQADSLEARVWLDRGEEPVVQRGDEVRVYYRTSHDAYAAIFRIDTDGVISLVFPQHPDMDTAVGAGRDYRLLFPRSARWRVDEDPGVGYFFMVASPEPLDFSGLGFDDERGWDLGEVGATVYEDPYVAIDDYVAAIVPDWDIVPYALDFLTYNVGDRHDYPRFLCYDCHTERRYSAWNPYREYCSTYRVVIWDDPYFYPRYRYVGTRVVFARPIGPRPRYGVVTRVGAPGAPLVRSRVAPPRRVVEYKESPRRPAFQPRNPAPSRGAVSPRPSRNPRSNALPNRAGPQSRPSATTRRGAPTAGRRPSATGSPAATPPTRAVTPPSARSRPTLQRRPPPPSARVPNRGVTNRGTANRGTTNRGTAGRGATSRGATRRQPAANPRGSATRPPPRATRQRPATRPPPRSGATRSRPSATRRPPPRAGSSRPPAARGRPAPARQPRAGSAGARPPTRRPPPRRRPGGRRGSGTG